MSAAALELYDPRNGDLSLKIAPLEKSEVLSEPKRFNYFTICWVQEGKGEFFADLGQHSFGSNSLLFFVPYQAIRIIPETVLRGITIQFHANFLCIETYHDEVGCNGVLFNDIYGVPSLELNAEQTNEVGALVGMMRQELESRGVAHIDLLLSYLKILLVKTSRLKLNQQPAERPTIGKTSLLLDDLKQLIETHYRALLRPGDYADKLHITSKALGKLVKAHFHKTLTELIRDRLLKQAKWDLLHTLKPVKQIADELGFEDEFYFSRLFKRGTGCAPTFFREYETEIRGGSNLSMPWRDASIPNTPSARV